MPTGGSLYFTSRCLETYIIAHSIRIFISILVHLPLNLCGMKVPELTWPFIVLGNDIYNPRDNTKLHPQFSQRFKVMIQVLALFLGLFLIWAIELPICNFMQIRQLGLPPFQQSHRRRCPFGRNHEHLQTARKTRGRIRRLTVPRPRWDRVPTHLEQDL